MGTWITYNHIEISNKTLNNGILQSYCYKDIDNILMNDIVTNDKIKWIQISTQLPEEGYQIIDTILEKRSDLIFRIYNLYGEEYFDISFLENMSHLKHLRIDSHLSDNPNQIDFNILTNIALKSLYLDIFDLKEYSFIQNLNKGIELLQINADTMGSTIKFDCEWLLRYKSLHELWLGKKAKKNVESLAQMESLKVLSLRGIKLKNFIFLKNMELKKLHLLWNSNSQLEELEELKSLTEIGLWRINKLENIDFLSVLTNLEVIKLQDLKHIRALPDLSQLHKLKTIVLDNTGIQVDQLDNLIREKVVTHWR